MTAMHGFNDGQKGSTLLGDVSYASVISAVCSSEGGKSYQEDMAVKIDDFNRLIPKKTLGVDFTIRRSFYAVFDGHGGARCSKFLAENFHNMLAKNHDVGFKPDEAIHQVWMLAEDKFLGLCSKKYEKHKADGDSSAFQKSGSTAAVVFIVGDTIYVANCGDSHVYLYRDGVAPLRLSDDHNTDNQKECARVRNAGAKVEQELIRRKVNCCMSEKVPAGKQRVWPGGLAITRSFGDYHAKLTAFGGVPDSVLYEFEELRKMDIEPVWRGLIIASDGAWDALTPEAIWRSFSESSNASPAETEAERLTAGLQTMVETCCRSDYWSSHGYDADNTTAIALSFNGAFAPDSAKGAKAKGAKAAEDSKEEEALANGAGAAGKGSGSGDLGLGEYSKPKYKKSVSFAQDGE